MRVAIVGCGQIADAHIQEARKVPGTEVVAVCDRNPHMAEQAAARFGLPGLFTDVDRMLDETRPDVVHVTTPPQGHLAITRAVLERGSHAYVEKPFTVTVAEAEELVDCAVRAGRLVCVGHNNAFDPAFLRLLERRASGELGEPVHVDTVMGYNLAGPFGSVLLGDPGHWIHCLPGGLAQNNISHPLSLIMPFLEDERPLVQAAGSRCRATRFGDARDRFFDELRVTLVGARVSASILFSCRTRPVQLLANVYGTNAHATVSIDGRTLRLSRGAAFPGPFARVQWAYQDQRESLRELLGHASSLLRARLHFFEGMRTLFERFYLAIEGRGEMPIPMSEAVRATRIMEDVFRSCRDVEESRC